jgi:secretion/DNA translocation related TadE-like protein
VWTLAVGLVTVVIAMAVAAAGAVIVARHRAQAAADLAALAGAARAVEGETAACARAGEIAAANGARLRSCRLTGWDLTVSTEVSPAQVAAVAGAATASARAGPATPST